MSHTDQSCIETVTVLLRGLEPTIPGLPERMAVRMLRMVLENNIAEIRQFDKSMQWEYFARIFLMTRASALGLSIACADTCSNASKLYSAIYDGLKTYNEDGSMQGQEHIFDRCNTDIGVVQFVMELYSGVISNLSDLTSEHHFMESMGPKGQEVFSAVIASLEAVQMEGQKIILLISAHSDV
jgi:hypothetical protein